MRLRSKQALLYFHNLASSNFWKIGSCFPLKLLFDLPIVSIRSRISLARMSPVGLLAISQRGVHYYQRCLIQRASEELPGLSTFPFVVTLFSERSTTVKRITTLLVTLFALLLLPAYIASASSSFPSIPEAYAFGNYATMNTITDKTTIGPTAPVGLDCNPISTKY